MSAIASFYLVRSADIPLLRQLAAAPVSPVYVRRWWWIVPYYVRQWRDAFSDFLSTKARELQQFDWSGYVIGSEGLLFLESRSVRIEDYCDNVLSDYLTKMQKSSVLVFTEQDAERLAHAIQSVLPNEAQLSDFLNSPEMKSPIVDPVPVAAVADGLAMLQQWLSQVGDDEIGLLTIG